MNKSSMIEQLTRLEEQYATTDPNYLNKAEVTLLCNRYPELVKKFLAGTGTRQSLKDTITDARERREAFTPYSDRNYPGYE